MLDSHFPYGPQSEERGQAQLAALDAQYQAKIMAEVERYQQLMQEKELLNQRCGIPVPAMTCTSGHTPLSTVQELLMHCTLAWVSGRTGHDPS